MQPALNSSIYGLHYELVCTDIIIIVTDMCPNIEVTVNSGSNFKYSRHVSKERFNWTIYRKSCVLANWYVCGGAVASRE